METVEPYSKEWYKARLGNVTASEVWKLMTEPRSKKEKFSKTAQTYILEKVHERVTGIPKESFNSIATSWGVENESLAIRNFTKRTGLEVFPSKYYTHPDMPKAGCTPDGEVEDGGLIEVKCPYNGVNHIEYCTMQDETDFKEMCKEYYWQTQMQMLVTGKAHCYFVSFDPRINSDMGLFILRIDQNAEDALLLDLKIQDALFEIDKYMTVFNQ